jgi:hypothetical protein
MTSPFGPDEVTPADEDELLDAVGEDEPDDAPRDAGAGGEEPAAP